MKKLSTMNRQDKSALLVAVTIATIIGAVWVVAQRSAATNPTPMAAMLPQGALLSIESPDFGALLHDWERSPEQAAWTKSDNYEMFSRSRLFSRLSEAQEQFAGAAGLAPDAEFLDEVAGTHSIFAWYDIGKLEFVYITQLSPGKAEQTRLMQSKSSFSQRQIGTSTFYVRTRADEQGDGTRTIAFAVSGDYLLLATREDLMANALALIAHASNDSLATDPWFVDATNAAGTNTQKPSLRMALDLDRIVKTPYFRSYWIQQNVTEIKQYRAAMVDLYREPTQMHEERVLLPKSVEDAAASQANLGDLVSLVPAHAGVYRAIATGDAEVAVTTLDEKLLRRASAPSTDKRDAPSEDLTEQDAGSANGSPANDLETRIDAPPQAPAKPGQQMQLLRAQLASTGVVGILTVDTNDAAATPAPNPLIWVPMHSGVVIQAERPWDEAAIESSIQQALAPQLSAGGLGLAWSRQSAGYSSLGQIRPLQIAVRGNLLVVADDPSLMAAILARIPPAPVAPLDAMSVSGFDHDAAAGVFTQFTSLLDRSDTNARQQQPAEADGSTPAFFSKNLVGLSKTFTAMKSERVVQRRDGPLTRQTVNYVWQH
jgi:hypothetical protein